jgi:hypothetical protein
MGCVLVIEPNEHQTPCFREFLSNKPKALFAIIGCSRRFMGSLQLEWDRRGSLKAQSIKSPPFDN